MTGAVVRWVVVPLSAVAILSAVAGALDAPLASFVGAFAKGLFLGWWYRTVLARQADDQLRKRFP